MVQKLTCEFLIEKVDVPDAQGRRNKYHVRCGKPASEVEVGGELTTARAILCKRHAAQADFHHYISTNGYDRDKISKKAEVGYMQTRLPGTGVKE